MRNFSGQSNVRASVWITRSIWPGGTCGFTSRAMRMCPRFEFMESQGLSTGHGAHDEERFSAIYDRIRQWGFGGFEGPIFFADEKPDERAALEREMVANRSAQNWMA